ncbi:glycogen synthase GlgA [Candidatus Laterigemmans baculatus]|uniref:glycogen synthase GlgA n=1 Tax=Candidatus Laterigemmans baculatus TaxID=2770505 RepID=UPI0013DB12A9|nr:glycogen synthase GlgA [Candidatus Laterigemmans baculatus]
MEVVFLTTEAVPFAKTGGLADVCGALPTRLANRGHRPVVIMPAFQQIYNAGLPIETTDISFAIPINDKIVGARLLRSRLPDSEVPVYFIDQPEYFGRPALYGDAAGDYVDNCERFAFFCRAALHAITRLDLKVDIVHCNDWQTGLVPAYIRTSFENHPWMAAAATVMTVHNLAYQGQFWHWDMLLTGLGWEHFNSAGMEFYGHLNLLKTGLVFADSLSTVSPQYAKEIQTAEHGCGLDGVLRARSANLVGIINGVDGAIWNPATDPHLSQNYNADSYREGKAANRTSLRAEFGLPDDPNVPLIGLIGRLADQKGWDLVIEAMRQELQKGTPMQWVVLGTGDPRYHDALQELANAHPDRLGLRLGFSNPLAHKIEAASDIFLMPSRYEPCGLNQLYSLLYGAVPVVNPTGGLADTVVDTTAETLAAGTATGFHMREYSVNGLLDALQRAALVRWDNQPTWDQIVRRGMRQDWSWRKSAAQYEHLYSETWLRKAARRAAPAPRPSDF